MDEVEYERIHALLLEFLFQIYPAHLIKCGGEIQEGNMPCSISLN